MAWLEIRDFPCIYEILNCNINECGQFEVVFRGGDGANPLNELLPEFFQRHKLLKTVLALEFAAS